MSEKEKMKAGHLYQSYDQELYHEREICKRMLYELNHLFIVSMVTILRLVLIFIVMLISPF